MATLNIGGRQVQVDDSFTSLSPEQQNATIAEIEKSLPPTTRGPAPGSGVVANIGAGANDWLAGVAGAPVDLVSGGLNAAARGANTAFGTSLPQISSPIGGAESIKSLFGAIGADPRMVVANTSGEKAARAVGGAIPATVAPYLAGRAMIERGATGLLPQMLGGPAGPGQTGAQTVAGGLSNAAVGAGGALAGHEAEALLPENSPWRGTANLVGNLAGGAATSALLNKMASGLASAVQPAVSPNVRLLQEEGVTPTPGQIVGGRANRLEEAATSVPWAGDAIKSARERANESFNRGAINRALRPIGEKLDEATPLGREAIVEAGDKITGRYNTVVPSLTARVDPQFASDMARLRQMAAFMPPDSEKQFLAVIDDAITSKISPNGTMLGPSFKEAESTLGTFARPYMHSSLASERQLGGAVSEAQSVLREWLARVNPSSAEELGKINEAFALMLRVQGAAARPGAEPGVFTPPQLQASIRQLDPTARHRGVARGEAMMQDYADAGRSVLGARVPDSGTPYRSMLAFLGGAGMGLNPAAAAVAGLSGAAASGMYSPRGQALIEALLTKRPAWAPDVSDAIRNAAPASGAPVWGALAP